MAVQTTPSDSLAEGMGTDVATKSRRAAPSKTRFLVVWWMSKNPYAAVFENRVAAEAAANVRNAILVAFKGANAEVETVVDWFRRDEEGRPMPAEWREPMGHRFRRPGARNSDRSDETVGPRRSVRRGTTERDGVHHGDGGRSTCHALRAGRKYRRSMYTPTTARIVTQAKSGPNKSKSA